MARILGKQRLALATTVFSVLLVSSACSMAASVSSPDGESQRRALELTDIMQFREIEGRTLSDDGFWLAYSAVPDYGDAEGFVVNTQTGQSHSLRYADNPKVNNGPQPYVAFRTRAPLFEREQAGASDADEATKERAKETHVTLLDVTSGEQQIFERVARFAFTGDGKYLLMLSMPPSDDEDATGQTLTLLNLAQGTQETLSNIDDFAVAEKGPRVAYTRTERSDAQENSDEEPLVSLWIRNTDNQSQLRLSQSTAFNGLAFSPAGDALAFLEALDGDTESSEHSGQTANLKQLRLWQYGQTLQTVMTERDGWVVTEHSTPEWSDDGERLFFGYQPYEQPTKARSLTPNSETELYDLERLLADRRLQVWHGDDARIVTHQRETYESRKKSTAPAVYWVADDRVVTLSESTEDNWQTSSHTTAQLIYNGEEYLREISWNGFFHDIDHVHLRTGERQRVASKVRSQERASLSPDGRYVAYLQDGQYHVFDSTSGESRSLATDAGVSWVDEENDRPMEAASYGIAGWLDDSSAFIAYDRYDIWRIELTGESRNLTATGREQHMEYRVRRLNDDVGLSSNEPWLIESYHEQEKYHGFYRLDPVQNTLEPLLEGNKRYRFVDFNAELQSIFFTEEDFRQFPDIWVANEDFSEPRQLTDVNPQIEQFTWGTPSLIDWQTEDGETLQGIVIKPDGYDPERTYPVLVYYYEKYSQRLYHFNQMKVNHRPNFPFYVGQDYVVFLPDIRFRLGAPGPSATESLLPGIDKLIEMGIADADAIGLHGHSWSGYQSAFVVTETDRFAAVVSGAPVSNMTSAYTGIRWQSGLARQFQYETGQSRIGPSMYQDIDPYIKNSPVFFADQINTPMLIQFGDADGAVPWEQGIEYYLALRRLNKPVAMLHYEDEPHHLQRYANKIDYSIKMLEFFDHYLKGAPAPDWWVEGMPYQAYDQD